MDYLYLVALCIVVGFIGLVINFAVNEIFDRFN